MRPAAKCAIVNIKLREARDIRPTPDDEQLNAFQHQPFTIRGSGRLFFSPEDRITQSYDARVKRSKSRSCLHDKAFELGRGKILFDPNIQEKRGGRDLWTH